MSRLTLFAAVRGVILANLPDGFVEEAGHYVGMQTWVVPSERTPKMPGNRTAPIVALGERKSYVSLFLMGLYYDPTMDAWLERSWRASGCPLDRGRVSLRLRQLDDVPLDVVAAAVSRVSVDEVVAFFERRLKSGRAVVVYGPADMSGERTIKARTHASRQMAGDRSDGTSDRSASRSPD